VAAEGAGVTVAVNGGSDGWQPSGNRSNDNLADLNEGFQCGKSSGAIGLLATNGLPSGGQLII
jgi:hypothetical protein